MGKDKSPYVPKSLDETYVPSDEPRMNPYDRLQSIFADNDAKSGKLTNEAAEKLDFLLGEEKKPSKISNLWQSIKGFFNKIDGLIFAKRSRMWNTTYTSRKKK